MTESHSADRFSNLPNTTLTGMGSAQVLCLLPPCQVNPRAMFLFHQPQSPKSHTPLPLPGPHTLASSFQSGL